MTTFSSQEYPLISPMSFHAQGVCAYDEITNEGKHRKGLRLSLHCADTRLLSDPLSGIRLVKILSVLVGYYPTSVHVKEHHAHFGLRKDDTFGFSCSLQDEEAEAFLFRLLYVFFPADPTFRGIPLSSITSKGDLSFVLPNLSLCPELEVLKPLLEAGCILQVSIQPPTSTRGETSRYLTERQFPLLPESAVKDTGR